MGVSWGLRAGRAVMFTAVCVLLAALGHVLMSEAPIPGWAVMPAILGIGGPAWLAAGRERGLPFIVLGTLEAQYALHTWFSWSQGGQPQPQTTHLHHAMPAATEPPVDHASLGMLAAHALAALLCGLWLAYGERATFSILRAVASRILQPLRLIARPAVVVPRPAARPEHFPGPYRRLLLAHAITSRGPPRGVTVV